MGVCVCVLPCLCLPVTICVCVGVGAFVCHIVKEKKKCDIARLYVRHDSFIYNSFTCMTSFIHVGEIKKLAKTRKRVISLPFVTEKD